MELDYTISWRQLQLLLNYESRALRTPEAWLFGSFGILGLTALWDSISLYIKLSPREREEEERNETSFCSYARPAQPGPIRWLGVKQA